MKQFWKMMLLVLLEDFQGTKSLLLDTRNMSWTGPLEKQLFDNIEINGLLEVIPQVTIYLQFSLYCNLSSITQQLLKIIFHELSLIIQESASYQNEC